MQMPTDATDAVDVLALVNEMHLHYNTTTDERWAWVTETLKWS